MFAICHLHIVMQLLTIAMMCNYRASLAKAALAGQGELGNIWTVCLSSIRRSTHDASMFGAKLYMFR
jgi:hypothetical protein